MIVLSTGAVLGVAIYFAERSVETLSRNVITQTSERTALELDRFFRPIEQQLREIQGWGRAGIVELSKPQGFLQLVQPFVEEHPEVTGLVFARDDGAELFVLVEDAGFAIRQSPPNNEQKAIWTRWVNGRKTESWTEATQYDARTRPWFRGALALKDDRQTFWTEPYTFFTTKVPGISASARFSRGGHRWVAAVDVSLVGISRFTTSLGVSEHGAVAVLADSGRVVGLPRNSLFEDALQMRSSMLKPVSEIGVPFLGEAVAAGMVGTDKSAYRFRSNGKDYWGGTQRFSLSPERPLLIQAAVPESDLIGDLQRQRNIILLVIALSLAVAVLVAYALGRRYEERLDAAVNQAQQLGQYTLEKRIGSGGMGSVYRARHAMLRRPTAVKLLNPKSSDPDAFARFEREVQLTAQLTHPNTIAVYDYGRTAEGVFYYAMEYLEGLSMRQLVKRFGPVNEARAIHLLRQVAGS
ncbi:MAG: protein kinase, partial [Myxococcota bacterium]